MSVKGVLAAGLVLAACVGCHHTALPAANQPTTRPISLKSGLGNVHHPVSSKSPLAQKYFEQGLAYVYAFNHAEAVRSFQRAGELDPNLAMAHWGEALALGPNINMDVDPAAEKAAFDALQKALALAKIAQLTGDQQAAVEYLRLAVAAQDAFSYDEPPAWLWPVRENLGAALLNSDAPDQAEQVFRRDLQLHPNNPRSLLGLATSLRAQHKDDEAPIVQSKAQTALKAADVAIRVEDFCRFGQALRICTSMDEVGRREYPLLKCLSHRSLSSVEQTVRAQTR